MLLLGLEIDERGSQGGGVLLKRVESNPGKASYAAVVRSTA